MHLQQRNNLTVIGKTGGLPLFTGGGPSIEQKEPVLPVRLAVWGKALLSLLYQIKRSFVFYENETHSTGLTPGNLI